MLNWKGQGLLNFSPGKYPVEVGRGRHWQSSNCKDALLLTNTTAQYNAVAMFIL